MGGGLVYFYCCVLCVCTRPCVFFVFVVVLLQHAFAINPSPLIYNNPAGAPISLLLPTTLVLTHSLTFLIYSDIQNVYCRRNNGYTSDLFFERTVRASEHAVPSKDTYWRGISQIRAVVTTSTLSPLYKCDGGATL